MSANCCWWMLYDVRRNWARRDYAFLFVCLFARTHHCLSLGHGTERKTDDSRNASAVVGKAISKTHFPENEAPAISFNEGTLLQICAAYTLLRKRELVLVCRWYFLAIRSRPLIYLRAFVSRFKKLRWHSLARSHILPSSCSGIKPLYNSFDFDFLAASAGRDIRFFIVILIRFQ